MRDPHAIDHHTAVVPEQEPLRRRIDLRAVVSGVAAVVALVVRIVTAAGDADVPARHWNLKTSQPICENVGIDTAGGREGHCIGGYGDGAGVIYPVVDAGAVPPTPEIPPSFLGSPAPPAPGTLASPRSPRDPPPRGARP